MPIDFPASPTTGQSFTANNQTWIYNGVGWGSGYQNSGFVRQTFTATSGQTVFTIAGGYVSGFVDVYQNGVKLVNGSDVTVSSGNVVVLAAGATAGDVIEVVGLASVALQNFLSLGGGTLSGALSGTSATFSGNITSSGGIVTGVTVADAVGTIRPLISGTAQNTTSGTNIDFTSIPSWVRRITLSLSGVSLSGTAVPRVQIGPSGIVETTGYLGTTGYIQNASSSQTANLSAGFDLIQASSAANLYHGSLVLTLLEASTNTWAASGIVATSNAAVPSMIGGSKALAGVLSILRLTSSNGTDTFDAGKANILYE